MLVGVAAVFGLAPWPATPASAHAFLLSTVPPAGYSSPSPPTEVVLDFDEPLTVSGAPIRLVNAGGQAQPLAALPPRNGGRQIAVRIVDPLPRGSYVVHWRAVSDDGDPLGGAFSFGVGVAATTLSSGQSNPGIGWAVAWRWMLFAGLALGLGGTAAARLARRRANSADLPQVKPWLTGGAVVSLLAAVALAIHVAGGGALLAGARHLTPRRLADSDPGRIVLTQIVAGGLAVTAALRRRRMPASLALLVIVGAEGWRSHLHARDGALGAALTGVHLLLAALWVGALVHVLRVGVAWRHHPGAARRLTLTYARLALAGVLALVGTGVVEALLLIQPWRAWWDSGYGQALLVKLGFVAVALAAAVAGRRRLRRRHADGRLEPGPAARGEIVALTGVLVATAVLVSLPTPAPVSAALAAPPAPVGPTVRLGTLVGQVSVALTASGGQAVVELSTPGSDEPGDTSDTPPESLTASVQSNHSPATALSWRRCGAGCFTAPVRWHAGQNQLRLAIAVRGFPAGTTTFTVPWYPVSAGDLARLAFDRLRAAPRLTLVETVTSDTTGLGARPQTLTLSAKRLFAAWPYGSGVIPQPVVLTRDGENTEIGFAYPAENLYFRWTLDPVGRLLAQTISAPAHLIHDQFRYR